MEIKKLLPLDTRNKKKVALSLYKMVPCKCRPSNNLVAERIKKILILITKVYHYRNQ